MKNIKFVIFYVVLPFMIGNYAGGAYADYLIAERAKEAKFIKGFNKRKKALSECLNIKHDAVCYKEYLEQVDKK